MARGAKARRLEAGGPTCARPSFLNGLHAVCYRMCAANAGDWKRKNLTQRLREGRAAGHAPISGAEMHCPQASCPPCTMASEKINGAGQSAVRIAERSCRLFTLRLAVLAKWPEFLPRSPEVGCRAQTTHSMHVQHEQQQKQGEGEGVVGEEAASAKKSPAVRP